MEFSSGIIHFLVFLGGLGIFIYGMKLMSEGLLKLTGKNLRKMFTYLTNKPIVGVMTGFLVTALLQSSSTTSVLTVSLVNTSLLTLKQSIGVIMGANIGTTVTSWIITLFGYQVNGLHLALIVLGVGLPMLFSKVSSWKNFSEFTVGFCFMMMGLTFMKEAIPDLSQDAEIISFLRFYKTSFLSTALAVLLGFLLTIIVQSSSVSIGVVQVLAMQGVVPIEFALPMVLGSNIGTTVTTNIAALVASADGKRVARIHTLINTIGMLWCMCFLTYVLEGLDFIVVELLESKYSIFSNNPIERGAVMPTAIASFHTAFNVLNTLLLVWFIPMMVKISGYLVSGKKSGFEVAKLDKNYLIEIPELEVLEAKGELLRLSKRVQRVFEMVYGGFVIKRVDREFLAEIDEDIQGIRTHENALIVSLSKVLQEHPSAETSQVLMDMSRITADLREVSLTCYRLAELVAEKTDSRIVLQQKEYQVLDRAFHLLLDALGQVALDVYQNDTTEDNHYEVYSEKYEHFQSNFKMIQCAQEENVDMRSKLLGADIMAQMFMLNRQIRRIGEVLNVKRIKGW